MPSRLKSSEAAATALMKARAAAHQCECGLGFLLDYICSELDLDRDVFGTKPTGSRAIESMLGECLDDRA